MVVETQANESTIQKGVERDFERQAIEIVQKMKRPFTDGERHLKMKIGTRASLAEALVQLYYQKGFLETELALVKTTPLKANPSPAQQEQLNLTIKDAAKLTQANVVL